MPTPVVDPPVDSVIYVDFSHGGFEAGTISEPMSSLGGALPAVAAGGTIVIQGDSPAATSSETFAGAEVINQQVRIEATGGTVRIGE